MNYKVVEPVTPQARRAAKKAIARQRREERESQVAMVHNATQSRDEAAPSLIESLHASINEGHSKPNQQPSQNKRDLTTRNKNNPTEVINDPNMVPELNRITQTTDNAIQKVIKRDDNSNTSINGNITIFGNSSRPITRSATALQKGGQRA